MYREWPHFQSAIDLIEMVLAKADGRIAAEYDRRLVPAAAAAARRRAARAAGARDRRRAGRLPATASCSRRIPCIRRSIDVRNPYVDPLNLVQVELLRRVRREADPRVRARADGHGQRHRRRHAKYGLTASIYVRGRAWCRHGRFIEPPMVAGTVHRRPRRSDSRFCVTEAISEKQ